MKKCFNLFKENVRIGVLHDVRTKGGKYIFSDMGDTGIYTWRDSDLFGVHVYIIKTRKI